VAGLLLLPWIVWNLVTFGTVMQSSTVAFPLIVQFYWQTPLLGDQPMAFALAKSWWPIGRHAFNLMVRYGGPGWGAWIVALILRRLLRRPPVQLRPLAPLLLPVGGALLILITHAVIRWYLRGWYLAPWAWASAVFVGPALAWLTRDWVTDSFGRKMTWLGGGVLALVIMGQAARAWAEPFYPLQHLMLKSARSIATEIPPDAILGSFGSGMHMYFSRQTVINLDGVVNWEALRALQERRLMAYIDQHHVRYLVESDEYIFRVYGPFYGADPHTRLRHLATWRDQVSGGGLWGIYEVMPPDGVK
jgi:hypothetical protein